MKKYKVFLYSGIISAALDLDHMIMLIKEGLPITFYNLEENGTRILHLPLFYALAIYTMITVIIFMRSLSENSTKNIKQN